MIKGIIFDNQAPTAKGIRAGFHSSLSDGILKGCSATPGNGNVSFSSGLIIVAGGIVELSDGQIVSIEGTSGYARVKAILDLSRTSAQDQFSQVYLAVDYANSLNTFSNLIQQEVNIGNGTIYEAELCVLALGSSGTPTITRVRQALPRIQYGDTLPETASEGTIFLLRAT